jgi:sporulation protein YlmC with PRC-barrel domain
MALVSLSSLANPGAADLGGYPNVIGWAVVGTQGKPVGRVVDLYLHDREGGVVSLVVEPDGSHEVVTVPTGDVDLEPDVMSVRVFRNLGEFARRPPRSHDRPLLLRSFLENYGVDEDTVDALEAAGILTLEQLRALTERGGLTPLLGPGRRGEANKVEKVMREQRL